VIGVEVAYETVELPVGLTEVVSLNVELLTETIGPITDPVTAAAGAALAGPSTTDATHAAARTATTNRRPCRSPESEARLVAGVAEEPAGTTHRTAAVHERILNKWHRAVTQPGDESGHTTMLPAVSTPGDLDPPVRRPAALPPHLAGDPVTARRGFFWVGVEPASVPAGTAPRGQMFVQWEAPPKVTKPYPLVLIHGGGGQGTDWLGTPDGRAGWATFLLEEGYAVYVIDRPGHGRAPFHPDVLGPVGGVFTQELVLALFTAAAEGPMAHPTAHLHTQWPGDGGMDDPSVKQFAAAAGPMLADIAAAHTLERDRGAALLDTIGSAVLVTHSAGGPMGWLTADARPELVKGIVAIEPLGPPFLDNPDAGFTLPWGLTAAPLHFEPPVGSPEDVHADVHALPSLAAIPIVVVDAEASLFAHADGDTVEFLREAGCTVEHLRLADHGVHGNGHLMMLERNNREALAPIIAWLDSYGL
jgi:pimeloyl-ACP methyl ester carboxylesterase